MISVTVRDTSLRNFIMWNKRFISLPPGLVPSQLWSEASGRAGVLGWHAPLAHWDGEGEAGMSAAGVGRVLCCTMMLYERKIQASMVAGYSNLAIPSHEPSRNPL